MDTEFLVNRFALMGARAQFRETVNNRWRRETAGIDIGSDERGEFFDDVAREAQFARNVVFLN